MNRWMMWAALVLAALGGCAVEDVRVDDASLPDAPPCPCDDGVACTRDFCDARGICVHESDCENGWCAALPDGNVRCESHECDVESDCRDDLPCAERVGCIGGFCRYVWSVDRDGDGERDQGCGGNDCQPNRREIPREELCNLEDDDCDGVVDNVTLNADPMNCGGCGRPCGSAMCVRGECVISDCGGGSRVACGGACVDLWSDNRHCGACGNACLVGGCAGGVCADSPSRADGVDRSTYVHWSEQTVFEVSANGDTLFEVILRPTRLMHSDRATEMIPPAASPFPLHKVRLDRDGNLVGLTSLPNFESWALRTMNDAGFYFVGVPTAAIELAGQRFEPRVALVGFVPRATGEIAWVHALHNTYGVRGAVALPSGPFALVVAGRGDGFREGETSVLRMFNTDGTAIPLAVPAELNVYDNVTTLLPGAAGGFLAFPTGRVDSLPIARRPGAMDELALRHDRLGTRIELVHMGTARPVSERDDGNAWIVQDRFSVYDFTRDDSQWIFDFMMGWTVPQVESATVDGTGYMIDGTRFRRGRTVAYFPGAAAIRADQTRAWLLNPSLEASPHLPGADAFVYRFDLRAIP